jgi:MFS family permease
MLFIALTFGAIITYIPALGAARKIGNIGTFFTAYAIAVVAARSFTGRIADRHGFTMIMVLGLLSMAASLAVLAFGATLPVILAAGALYGFGYGITFPLANAIAIKLCPSGRRGAATGTIFAAMDIGIGVGAFLWGWVSELSGFTAVYLLAGVCIVVSGWIYFVSVRRRIPGEIGEKTAEIPS